MNWSLPGVNAEVQQQQNEGFFNSNPHFHDFNNISSTYCQDLNQQKKLDEDFIKSFELSIQKKEKCNPKKIKISDAKSLLIEIINDKQDIKNAVCNLDVNDENFNLKYESLLAELNKINNRILRFDKDIKKPLATALHKRKKKRTGIKVKREKFKSLKKLEQQKNKEKHDLINKLLNEKKEEVEIIKHEAALKRQADTVLHEVRRKKHEAKKMLNLLVSLTKLRELRSKGEEQRGGYCSKQLTETFNSVMFKFQKLWEKQLEVYKLEEKGLKIMLEENTIPHKKESKFETNLLQWDKVLFGDIANDYHEKLLNLPQTDIQALIQVRRDWDQFLVSESTPMASSIPLGWVLPPETEDERWKAFTKTNKTQV